ncbi:protein of unknown function [Rhodovastum atsumiense]|uniref:hypothetical protein n=1 Tax=Rhodovastum atsumiense TaxID=504468 RepID=UPI00139F29B2|nr:hypothetical protein [Rhodovastum atsumiense]CAH2600048.1 protein of unknown function [Rhodovastum atsumiense]
MTAAKRLTRTGEGTPACTVLVSGTTRALLGDAFRLRAIGPVFAKGKAQPVVCHVLED